MNTPLLNAAFPGSGPLSQGRPLQLIDWLPEKCVALHLSRAIKTNHTLAVNVSPDVDAPLFCLLDPQGLAWFDVPNDVWLGVVQEAAAVVVGAPVSLIQVRRVLVRLMRANEDGYQDGCNHHLYRFPGGDLACLNPFSRNACYRAYRSAGTARSDGIDMDWSNVDASSHMRCSDRATYAIRETERALQERLKSYPSYLNPVLAAGEVKMLRDLAGDAMVEAGNPEKVRLRRRL